VQFRKTTTEIFNLPRQLCVKTEELLEMLSQITSLHASRRGRVVTLVVLCFGLCPTHSTTRVTTYTCYTYCCHKTGIDLQDFKFSVC